MYRTLYRGLAALPAPAHITRIITRRGGLNQFGEPMYRLVRSEGRTRLSGGRWFDWQSGLKTKDKNAGLRRAVRSVVGMKPVPMYPGIHGWVLERYVSADKYGSPVQWYSPQSMGGTKRWMGAEFGYLLSAGHYPYKGDYEGTGYVFPTSSLDGSPELCGQLSEAVIANAIGRIQHALDEMPSSPYRRAQLEIEAALREEKTNDWIFNNFADEELEAALSELQVNSVEARAQVGKDIERMGIREHAWN